MFFYTSCSVLCLREGKKNRGFWQAVLPSNQHYGSKMQTVFKVTWCLRERGLKKGKIIPNMFYLRFQSVIITGHMSKKITFFQKAICDDIPTNLRKNSLITAMRNPRLTHFHFCCITFSSASQKPPACTKKYVQ